MFKYIFLLTISIITFFTDNSQAYTVPSPPNRDGYVLDQAGILTAPEIIYLNNRIDKISKSTGSEFEFVLLPHLGDANIEEVSNSIFQSWGIGKKNLDNGILVLVAIDERLSRIETGKETETKISDPQALDILENNLNPHLKKGDFSGGFNETLSALSLLLDKNAATINESPTQKSSGLMYWVSAFVVMLALVGVWLVRFLLRNARKEQEAEAKFQQGSEAIRRQINKAVSARKDAEDLTKHIFEERASLNIKAPVVIVPQLRSTILPPAPKTNGVNSNGWNGTNGFGGGSSSS